MKQALTWAAGGTLFLFAMTTLGAATVFLFVREPRERLRRWLLGFAAGIMTAAAGAVMLLLYVLLTRTELAQSAGTMGSLLMLLAGGRNLSLYLGLLLSGAWCALGKEK